MRIRLTVRNPSNIIEVRIRTSIILDVQIGRQIKLLTVESELSRNINNYIVGPIDTSGHSVIDTQLNDLICLFAKDHMTKILT